MAEFLSDFVLFFLQVLTIAAVLLFVVTGIISLLRREQVDDHRGQLHVRRLNDRFQRMEQIMEQALLTKPLFKLRRRQRRRDSKQRRKSGQTRGRAFVLNFHGDIRASQVEALREEITAVLGAAEAGDEVVLRLESAGGMVHGYGLAASQLRRLRERDINLTVAVDKVAASGGYMMACVADRILTAPFAIVGSIGVVAQLPNFHRLLRRHDIDFELHTAGEHKRTLTLFGRNTDAARRKFREDLDDAHALFKEFVGQHRPLLDIDRVATGEYWFGQRALELGLADEIRTSDDYLLELSRDRDVFEVTYRLRPRLSERIAGSVSSSWRKLLRGFQEDEHESRLLR